MNGEASVFPRIDKDHPLSEAARIVNAYAEEHGMDATLEWLQIGTGSGELAYLCEQRALRAVAAASGVNMGYDDAADEHVARAIVNTPLWRDMRTLLLGCVMDGIVTAWKARTLGADAVLPNALLARLMAAIETPDDLSGDDVSALLEDVRPYYRDPNV